MITKNEILRIDFESIQTLISDDVERIIWATVRNKTNEIIVVQLRTHVRRDIMENWS